MLARLKQIQPLKQLYFSFMRGTAIDINTVNQRLIVTFKVTVVLKGETIKSFK